MAQLKRTFQPPPGQADTVIDALGRQITIYEWSMGHIMREHPELDGMSLAIKTTIETATVRQKSEKPNHEIYFAPGIGPSRYFAVVVRFKGSQGWVITAYGCSKIKGEK